MKRGALLLALAVVASAVLCSSNHTPTLSATTATTTSSVPSAASFANCDVEKRIAVHGTALHFKFVHHSSQAIPDVMWDEDFFHHMTPHGDLPQEVTDKIYEELCGKNRLDVIVALTRPGDALSAADVLAEAVEAREDALELLEEPVSAEDSFGAENEGGDVLASGSGDPEIKELPGAKSTVMPTLQSAMSLDIKAPKIPIYGPVYLGVGGSFSLGSSMESISAGVSLGVQLGVSIKIVDLYAFVTVSGSAGYSGLEGRPPSLGAGLLGTINYLVYDNAKSVKKNLDDAVDSLIHNHSHDNGVRPDTALRKYVEGFAQEYIDVFSDEWLFITKSDKEEALADKLDAENMKRIDRMMSESPKDVPEAQGGIVWQFTDVSFWHPTTWGSTKLWFRVAADGKTWTWSPDGTNWMPLSTVVVSGGVYNGRKPTGENQKLIQALHSVFVKGGRVFNDENQKGEVDFNKLDQVELATQEEFFESDCDCSTTKFKGYQPYEEGRIWKTWQTCRKWDNEKFNWCYVTGGSKCAYALEGAEGHWWVKCDMSDRAWARVNQVRRAAVNTYRKVETAAVNTVKKAGEIVDKVVDKGAAVVNKVVEKGKNVWADWKGRLSEKGRALWGKAKTTWGNFKAYAQATADMVSSTSTFKLLRRELFASSTPTNPARIFFELANRMDVEGDKSPARRADLLRRAFLGANAAIFNDWTRIINIKEALYSFCVTNKANAAKVRERLRGVMNRFNGKFRGEASAPAGGMQGPIQPNMAGVRIEELLRLPEIASQAKGLSEEDRKNVNDMYALIALNLVNKFEQISTLARSCGSHIKSKVGETTPWASLGQTDKLHFRKYYRNLLNLVRSLRQTLGEINQGDGPFARAMVKSLRYVKEKVGPYLESTSSECKKKLRASAPMMKLGFDVTVGIGLTVNLNPAGSNSVGVKGGVVVFGVYAQVNPTALDNPTQTYKGRYTGYSGSVSFSFNGWSVGLSLSYTKHQSRTYCQASYQDNQCSELKTTFTLGADRGIGLSEAALTKTFAVALGLGAIGNIAGVGDRTIAGPFQALLFKILPLEFAQKHSLPAGSTEDWNSGMKALGSAVHIVKDYILKFTMISNAGAGFLLTTSWTFAKAPSKGTKLSSLSVLPALTSKKGFVADKLAQATKAFSDANPLIKISYTSTVGTLFKVSSMVPSMTNWFNGPITTQWAGDNGANPVGAGNQAALDLDADEDDNTQLQLLQQAIGSDNQ